MNLCSPEDLEGLTIYKATQNTLVLSDGRAFRINDGDFEEVGEWEYHPAEKIDQEQLEEALANISGLSGHKCIDDGDYAFIIKFKAYDDINVEDVVKLAHKLNISQERINISMDGTNNSCSCHPEMTYFVVVSVPKIAEPVYVEERQLPETQ